MQLPKFFIAVLTVSAVLAPSAIAQDPAYNGPPPTQPQQGQAFPQPAPNYAQQPGGYYPAGATMPPGQPAGQPGQAPNFTAPPGYPQGAAMMPPSMMPAPAMQNGKNSGRPIVAMSLPQWFNAYDNIRHQAQMSPQERQRADTMLSKGVSMLVPGDEKIATKALLVSMVGRYQRACMQLKSLPVLNQTTNLHHAYYNYFATASQLFGDYVRVQDNLFVTDATTGQPLAASLMQRKQMLEQLEHQCKALDAQTRQQFGMAPYPW